MVRIPSLAGWNRLPTVWLGSLRRGQEPQAHAVPLQGLPEALQRQDWDCDGSQQSELPEVGSRHLLSGYEPQGCVEHEAASGLENPPAQCLAPGATYP